MTTATALLKAAGLPNVIPAVASGARGSAHTKLPAPVVPKMPPKLPDFVSKWQPPKRAPAPAAVGSPRESLKPISVSDAHQPALEPVAPRPGTPAPPPAAGSWDWNQFSKDIGRAEISSGEHALSASGQASMDEILRGLGADKVRPPPAAPTRVDQLKGALRRWAPAATASAVGVGGAALGASGVAASMSPSELPAVATPAAPQRTQASQTASRSPLPLPPQGHQGGPDVVEPQLQTPGLQRSAPPELQSAPAPALAAAPPEEPKPPEAAPQPGVLDKVQTWLKDPTNRMIAYGAAGVTAVGALAYLLTRSKKKRSED